MIPHETGRKIKKIRELKNYTQTYMANRLSITQKAYSKIENCETKVTDERLDIIAKILDVDKEEILTFNESQIFNSYNNKGDGIVFKKIILAESEKSEYNEVIKSKNELINSLKDIISNYEKILNINK